MTLSENFKCVKWSNYIPPVTLVAQIDLSESVITWKSLLMFPTRNKDHLPSFFVPGRTATPVLLKDRTFDRIVMERVEVWNDWNKERQAMMYPKEPEDYLIGINLWGETDDEQYSPKIRWAQKPNLPPIEEVFLPGTLRVYFTEDAPYNTDQESSSGDQDMGFFPDTSDEESVSYESPEDPDAYHRLPLPLR